MSEGDKSDRNVDNQDENYGSSILSKIFNNSLKIAAQLELDELRKDYNAERDNSFDTDFNEFAEENSGIDFNTDGNDYLAVEKALAKLEGESRTDGNESEDQEKDIEINIDDDESDDAQDGHDGRPNKPDESFEELLSPKTNSEDSKVVEKENERSSQDLTENKLETHIQINEEQNIEHHKEENESIGEAPKQRMSDFKDESKPPQKVEKANIPPAPALDLDAFRNAQAKIEEINKKNKQTSAKKHAKKKSSSIMDETDIERIKSRIEQAKKEKTQTVKIEDSDSFNLSPHAHHHRQPEILDEHIDEELAELDEKLAEEEGKLDMNGARTFSFNQALNDRQEIKVMPKEAVSTIKEVNEEYNTFNPTRPHIVVDDPSMDTNEAPQQVFSPKFEADDDRELNQRDEQFEDLKMNKMLVANIEALQSELQKARKHIVYLEEYNTQLNKSKNDLYQEKEDLIKRSIEFEYLQKQLNEKDKRLSEIEKENSRRTNEINTLKKDNDNLRQQMDSMIQFIKKLATSKIVQPNTDEEGGTNEELVEAINVFTDRLRSSPETSLEEINTPDFLGRPTLNGQAHLNQSAPIQIPDEGYYMNDSSPARKIIKRRYKIATKSKKKSKIPIVEKPPSPLNQEQIKLLYDPQSFEKYGKDLDVREIRNLHSAKKKHAKLKKHKSTSRGKIKKSRNKVSPFRTEGLFNTYGAPEGNSVEREQIKDSLINQIKKKGPSYSQLQKKKKKLKKKTDKKKQTFYEKVLARNIGDPLTMSYDKKGATTERQPHMDPMNRTHDMRNISSHLPESQLAHGQSRNMDFDMDKYSGYQPGGINISIDGKPVSSLQQFNRYASMDRNYPEILEQKNYIDTDRIKT